MPTYDYACAACGHGFERFEPIGADGKKKCPECGKKQAKRMLGVGVGVIFKGAGFYTTDSRKPAPSESGGESKKTESKGEGEGKSKKTDGKKAKAKKKEKESKS